MYRILGVLLLASFVYGLASSGEEATSRRKSALSSKVLPSTSPEDERNEEARQEVEITIDHSRLWPTPKGKNYSVVSYTVRGDMPGAFFHRINILAMGWNMKVPWIKWEGSTSRKDFVSFNIEESCESKVGRQGGRQALQVAANCADDTSILHHMMRTVGVYKLEHNRIDRDQYIKVNWENIEEDYREMFDKRQTEEPGIGEYDYYTCMHYNITAFSSDQKHSFEVLKDGVDIDKVGRSKELTKGDIEKLRKLYEDP